MKAFIKKEWMEMTRTGRLMILGIVFILFGIMNPAIAKLTPYIMDAYSDTLAESGFTIGEITVNAMSSWQQFYKNTPLILVIIILMCSGFLINEYNTGTLIQVVTKGLSRRKVLLAKMLVLYAEWTVLFGIYFGVTYAYTAYYWGEDEVKHLMFGVFMYWLLGMTALSLMVFFSTIAHNAGQVLLGTGGSFAVMLFLGYIPKLKKILPIRLMDGLEVITGTARTGDYSGAIITAAVIVAAATVMSMTVFDRRQL